MFTRQGLKFLGFATLQVAIFLTLSAVLNHRVSEMLVTRFEAKIPDLRREDWYYHDVAVEYYLRTFVEKFGSENIVVFTGNCVTYQDSLRPSANISVLSEYLLNIEKGNRYKTLNLGVKGTDSTYLWETIEPSLALGITHIYSFLPLYVYYHPIEDQRLKLFQPEAAMREKYSIIDFKERFDQFRSGRHVDRLLDIWLLRNLVRIAPWMAYTVHLKEHELPLLAGDPPKPTLESDVPDASVPEAGANTEHGLGAALDYMFTYLDRRQLDRAVYSKFEIRGNVPYLAYPEDTSHLDDLGKRIVNANPLIAHLAGLLEYFRPHSKEMKFLITPTAERTIAEINPHGKNLPAIVQETIVNLAKSNGYDIYADMTSLPQAYFGEGEKYIVNGAGSSKVVSYLQSKDSFFNAHSPALTPLFLTPEPVSNQSQLNFIGSSKSAIQFLRSRDAFLVTSTGGDQLGYLEAPLSSFTAIKGSVSDVTGTGRVRVAVENQRKNIVAEWLLSDQDEFEIMRRGSSVIVRIGHIDSSFNVDSNESLGMRLGNWNEKVLGHFSFVANIDLAWNLLEHSAPVTAVNGI